MASAALLAHRPHPGLTPYGQVVKALSPSLYWALDNRTGALDLSGNGRHGTGGGGVAIGAFAGSPITGEASSTDFDDSNDQITSAYNPFANGSVRTYASWAYRDTSTGADSLFGGGSNTYIQLVSASTTFRIDLEFGAGTFVDWAAAWPGNAQWAHWALVIDEPNDLGTLYINGATTGAVAVTDSYAASPGNLQIGTDMFANYFDGKMAHFAVFESGLSAGNIETLADATP